jgi:hypothetical protein
MQTNLQSTTWVTFFTESVKILGPALLALAGSYIALRHQRRLRETEIAAQSTFKARELLFAAYERELEGTTKDLKDYAKALQTLAVTLDAGSQAEQWQAVIEFRRGLTSIIQPIFAGMERLEEELKNEDLLKRHEKRLADVKESSSIEISITDKDSAKKAIDRQFMVVTHLVVMFQELLDTKRRKLLAPYL